MLARLQVGLVLMALGAALGWSAWAWQQGLAPGIWLAGLALALAPHAPVLALEFWLLAWLGRDARAPRATAGQLLRAWAAEVLISLRVFGWRQPFAAGREPDVPGRPGHTAVLLIHGYVCNRGLWAPWLRRLRQAGVPCQALSMQPVFGRIETWRPQIEAAVAALQAQTGRPPLLVGHSMGGLAIRAWLAAQPDAAAADARVAGVVTIGTPHQGTWLARWGLSANARQMRPGSPWLTALAAAETPARRQRFTCFYSHADNVVFPATTATLDGADNRHLPGAAHLQLVFEAPVLAEVLCRVTVPRPPVSGLTGQTSALRAAE